MAKKFISSIILGTLMISGIVLALQTSPEEAYTPQRIPLKDLGIEDDPLLVVLEIYKDKILIILPFQPGGIYVYNLTSQETMDLTANIPGDMIYGSIYEDIVVWSEEREIKKDTNGNMLVSGIYISAN